MSGVLLTATSNPNGRSAAAHAMSPQTTNDIYSRRSTTPGVPSPSHTASTAMLTGVITTNNANTPSILPATEMFTNDLGGAPKVHKSITRAAIRIAKPKDPRSRASLAARAGRE